MHWPAGDFEWSSPAWVFSGYSGIFQKSKDMKVNGDSKLPVGVYVSMSGVCLSLYVALWRTGDLFGVYPTSHPVPAR